MSTRSEIGILNNDGTITSIYCHWDGYSEYNGAILYKYYTNDKIVKELTSNGNLNPLRENINPNKDFEHSFKNAQENVCVYYNRDRGEKWESVKPVTYRNISDWEKQIKKGWQEYMYLFQNDNWYFTSTKGKAQWEKLKSHYHVGT